MRLTGARLRPASPEPRPDAILKAVEEGLDLRLDPACRAPIAVSFSGGGDSLALLLAARAWGRKVGRPVIALTVDHRLQAQSSVWTEQARMTARSLGIGFEALAWTGDKPAHGLPSAARRARHTLLARAAREACARVILMGHTRDDVLESGIMRAEGSNVGQPRTWSPSPVWPEGRGLFLLRPLLGLRRAQLRQMLGGTGLDWIEDPANDDSRYARARARRMLTEEGGDIDIDGADDDCQAVAKLAKAASTDRFGVIRIDRSALAEAPHEAARRFLAMAAVCAGGGERLPRAEQTARLLQRILAGGQFATALAGARVDASDRVQFMRNTGDLVRDLDAGAPPAGGAATVWDGRFELIGARHGLAVEPLQGKATRLGPVERRRLKACAPAARPALPVVRPDGESVTCPILADGAWTRARCLVGDRLLAASGVIAREDQLGAGPHGEPDPGVLS